MKLLQQQSYLRSTYQQFVRNNYLSSICMSYCLGSFLCGVLADSMQNCDLKCTFCVQGDGSQITVEPGLIGGEINRILARHKAKHNHPIQYKIGPDPSSIDSCMVGGMVSNNSSGMCCGVSQNTYHTLKDMRIVFLDGTVLDTADPKSREAFLEVRCCWPTLVCFLQPGITWYACLQLFNTLPWQCCMHSPWHCAFY